MLLSKNKLADHFALMPWLVVPYDSLTHLMGQSFSDISQTLPLTAVLSIPYVLVRNFSLCLEAETQKIIKLLLLCFAVFLTITLVNIFLESITIFTGDLNIRFASSLRQIFSFVLGVFSFFMFADSAQRLGVEKVFNLLLLAAIPTLIFVLIQFLTGGYSLMPGRVQGFSSEPSHLADFLAYAFIPACISARLRIDSRCMLLMFGFLALLLTYSTTGYLKALFLVLCFIVLNGHLVVGIFSLACIALLGYVGLMIDPDNYVVWMLSSIIENINSPEGLLLNGSLIDRFFGLAGPIMQLTTWHGIIGFGFGGDSVYFHQLFSPEIAETISLTKGSTPSIASLQGKLLMYGGLIGYFLYMLMWRLVWQSSKRSYTYRFILPAVFAGSLFSLGPLFLPYVWMWWAICCTQNSR